MPYDDPQSADSPTLIRDPDEAAEVFSKAGIDPQFERIRDRGAFSVDFKNYAMGGAELVCTQWGTDTWLRVNFTDRMAVIVSPDDFTPSVFTISGQDVPASTKSAPIMQPDRKISVFRPEQTPLFVLSADLKELQRHFRDITGTDPGHLEFASGLDRDTPEGKRFQRIINYAVNELQEEPSALLNPIIRRQLDDLVLSTLLTLPGDHHRLIDSATGLVASSIVRRAEEFMGGNVERPISMSDVVAECGCSRTKLFQAFRQERQCTPLQFLVRRRMDRARRRLLAPSDGMNVTTVALDSGYANFSHFAQHYRRLFGETPSTTLKRSR
jgi:AraC-like DNA-binding protein